MPLNGRFRFEAYVDVGSVHLFDKVNRPLELLKETLEEGHVISCSFVFVLNSTGILLI